MQESGTKLLLPSLCRGFWEWVTNLTPLTGLSLGVLIAAIRIVISIVVPNLVTMLV